MAKPTLLDVYKYLPQTNCGECGEVNCMSFASKLLERRYKPSDCPPLVKESKYKDKMAALTKLVAPPVRAVVIGKGKNAVTIGGKEVMYRHELTLHNPTAIAVDVSDLDPPELIEERCKKIEGFKVIRIGDELKLNLVAVRAASADPSRFEKAVEIAAKSCSYPMVLCSFDPTILAAALRKPEVADSRPLLYAATKDNWREMVVLARKYNCPIVAFEPGGLDELKSLALTIKANGVEDIVLDPGTYTDGAGLRDTLNKFVMIRRAAIKAGDEGLGYPILGVPAITWLDGGEDPVKSYEEAYLAAVMMARSADILILHTLQPYALLALTTLRQNLYSDPRKPVAVEPGLRTFGRPSEDSPVLVTTNFALTYYTVANDIESQGNNCYLLVANTGGLAVECSVAGGQFNASVVKNLIDETKIETKVKHRILIIPQLAARLKGDIEDTTQWEVIVGPRDSSQIRDFLNKNWPPQKN
ncbi:MAG: acetyl-CoA decarbonylase/synthase complex subunit gamma [Nitrososphaerales archaeon]